MPTLSLPGMFGLIGEVARVLDHAGIHLSIGQLVLIGIVWFRQTNAYEVRQGLVFYTPRGVPQVSIHNNQVVEHQINDLIEERLSLNPRH